MESLYNNLTEKKFKLIAIFFCFLGDLVISKFAWIIVSKKDLFEKVFLIFIENMKSNPEFRETAMPKSFFNELFQLSMQAAMAVIALVILIHIINYIFYFKGKVFAYKYLKIQSWLGGLGLCALGFPNLLLGGFNIAMAVSGLLLIYVGIGLGHFSVKSQEPKALLK